jgi:sec-independent protein translocase protein TatB
VFDLSLPKLLVLAVIALVIFGPSELPQIASQAGRALRDLRKIAEGAKNDLREGLGPEFADFEIDDLNPRRFVHKHLSGDLNADQGTQQQPARQAAPNGTPPRRVSARRSTRTRHEPRASTRLLLRPRTMPTVPLETRGRYPARRSR